MGMDIDQDFNTKELTEIAKAVAVIAHEARGFNKSEQVSKHDAAHLMLVKKNRTTGVKSWFLTKDRTLADARLKLGQKRPLYFSLSSLIQCISPFVQTSQTESLFSLFEKVLEDDVSLRGVRSLFELSELQIMCVFLSHLFAIMYN